MKLLLLLSLTASLHCNDFDNYKHCFNQNRLFYELFLSNSEELTPLGRMHLLGLRYLIDIRLEDDLNVYRDSCELYEIICGDEYLEQEFVRKYR